MIKPFKKIVQGEKDRTMLDKARNLAKHQQAEQPESYCDRVVLKPWGHEFLLFENDLVGIWFLRVTKDHATSMHCHPQKQTSLTLLSGKALCNTFRQRNFLSAGDSLLIDPGVFHSTKAISLDGINLIEIETPPAKLDLLRLDDSYGRQQSGYEGRAQMVTENLERYRHLCINEKNCATQKLTMTGQFTVSMERFTNSGAVFIPEAGTLYAVCRGGITTENDLLLGIGETARGSYLQQFGKLLFQGETTLLEMTVFA